MDHESSQRSGFQDSDNDYTEDEGADNEYTEDTDEETGLEHRQADHSSIGSDQSYQYDGLASPGSPAVGLLLMGVISEALTCVTGHER
jgi:hypothetical protein